MDWKSQQYIRVTVKNVNTMRDNALSADKGFSILTKKILKLDLILNPSTIYLREP